MRLVSILIVVAALVLAGIVAFVVPRMMRGSQQMAAAAPARLAADDVLVAAHDLASGTIIKPEDVKWQRWPEEALDASFIVREKGGDPGKLAVGRAVLQGIPTGEPITALRLLKPGDAGFLAAALTPGMRAASIKIDLVSGTAGFILPGDHVDVMLTEHYALSAGEANPNVPQITAKDVISIILRNVRVLAIDQSTQDLDAKPKVGVTATLEVDAVQAERLALATQMGTLSLMLRSYVKPERPESDATSIVQDYQVSPYRASLMQQSLAGASSPQAQGPAASPGNLRVYHGAVLGAAGQ